MLQDRRRGRSVGHVAGHVVGVWYCLPVANADDWLSVRATAEELGLNPDTIRKRVQRKKQELLADSKIRKSVATDRGDQGEWELSPELIAQWRASSTPGQAADLDERGSDVWLLREELSMAQSENRALRDAMDDKASQELARVSKERDDAIELAAQLRGELADALEAHARHLRTSR